MNIMAIASRQRLVIQAEEFAGLAGASGGSLAFEDGRTIALTQIMMPNPTAVIAPLSADEVSRALTEIAFGRDITVRIGSASVHFPVQSAAGEAGAMSECMEQL